LRHTCTRTRAHTRTHAHTHTHTHARTHHTHSHVHTPTRTCTHTHVHVHSLTHAHTRIHAMHSCTHTRLRINKYINKHTQNANAHLHTYSFAGTPQSTMCVHSHRRAHGHSLNHSLYVNACVCRQCFTATKFHAFLVASNTSVWQIRCSG
jgi:hypothetical protein